MFGRVKMPGRVLVLRRIAAADVPAGETQAQMNPGISHFEALLAALRVRMNVPNLVEMRAWSHGGRLSSQLYE
jgi:hypothetical protein